MPFAKNLRVQSVAIREGVNGTFASRMRGGICRLCRKSDLVSCLGAIAMIGGVYVLLRGKWGFGFFQGLNRVLLWKGFCLSILITHMLEKYFVLQNFIGGGVWDSSENVIKKKFGCKYNVS